MAAPPNWRVEGEYSERVTGYKGQEFGREATSFIVELESLGA